MFEAKVDAGVIKPAVAVGETAVHAAVPNTTTTTAAGGGGGGGISTKSFNPNASSTLPKKQLTPQQQEHEDFKNRYVRMTLSFVNVYCVDSFSCQFLSSKKSICKNLSRSFPSLFALVGMIAYFSVQTNHYTIYKLQTKK